MPEPADHLVSLEYILGLTAFTAGTVDIVSFTQLGGVFASAMTGNLAFLGLYVAKAELFPAIASLIALGGFIVGTAVGQLRARGRPRRVALTYLLASEVILLALAVALWFAVPHRLGSVASDAIIALLAFAMGSQSIVGKQINLSNIPTVVFTSTLTNIVIGLTDQLTKREGFALSADTKRQLVSFSLYLCGAFCAGVLVHLAWSGLIALPVLAIGIALAIHLAARPERI